MTQLFMVHPGPLSAVTEPALAAGHSLRLLRAEETAELAAVLAESYDEPWDVARVAKELTAAADVVATWVVTDAEGIVAAASERLLPEQYPGAGYLHWVAVPPRARGRRLSEVVVTRCIAGFAGRGLSTVVLETDDFRVPAVVTYLRLGFVPSYRSDDERSAWSALLPTLLGAAR